MKGINMKIDTIKKRLAKDRPMVSITMRMPEDVVNDLKRIAPIKGFGGYQGLLRSYVGAGLRVDLERLEGSGVAQLVEKLREVGVTEETLNMALSFSFDKSINLPRITGRALIGTGNVQQPNQFAANEPIRTPYRHAEAAGSAVAV